MVGNVFWRGDSFKSPATPVSFRVRLSKVYKTNNMEFRCCFCSAIEEEVPLIELSSNLLVIENTHYEFSRVFAELFGLVSGVASELFYFLLISNNFRPPATYVLTSSAIHARTRQHSSLCSKEQSKIR